MMIDLSTEEGVRKAREIESELKRLAKLLKCKPLEVSGRLYILLGHIKELEREKERLTKLLNKEMRDAHKT